MTTLTAVLWTGVGLHSLVVVCAAVAFLFAKTNSSQRSIAIAAFAASLVLIAVNVAQMPLTDVAHIPTLYAWQWIGYTIAFFLVGKSLAHTFDVADNLLPAFLMALVAFNGVVITYRVDPGSVIVWLLVLFGALVFAGAIAFIAKEAKSKLSMWWLAAFSVSTLAYAIPFVLGWPLNHITAAGPLLADKWVYLLGDLLVFGVTPVISYLSLGDGTTIIAGISLAKIEVAPKLRTPKYSYA